MSTETRDRASVCRYIDWNRAFQTISSARYDERAWTVCSNASSMPDSRTRISASASLELLAASARPAGWRSSIGWTMRPRQRKERHLVPLERQQRVAPHRAAAAVRLQRAEQHLRLELDDLVAPPVDDAEHQALAVADTARRPRWRLKSSDAVGRVNRANSRPVASA